MLEENILLGSRIHVLSVRLILPSGEVSMRVA